MSWLKFVLVFLQSLCITYSCCIFEVQDSYGNVVVIVSMKKCLKMQTETAIRVMIRVSVRFFTMWHNFRWNFFIRVTPFSAHVISDHRISDQKVRTVMVRAIVRIRVRVRVRLEVRWSEMQWAEK